MVRLAVSRHHEVQVRDFTQNSVSNPVVSVAEFAPDLILAQILQISDGAAVRAGYVQGLAELIPSSARVQLSTQLQGGLAPWINLAAETHPRIFYQDLYHLAQRAERGGAVAIAARAYDFLQSAEAAPAELRRNASNHLSVLQGTGGPTGMRVERWLQGFMREVTAPELIVGMGVGSLAYGVGRAFGLRSLAGLGLRGRGVVLAGRSFALATEASGFVLASQGTGRLLGHHHYSIFHDFGQHWTHAAWMLGWLRAAGWGVKQFLGPLSPGATGFQRFGWQSAQQAAMYVGLVGSSTLGQSFGLAPERSFGQVLSASLAELITFQVAGRLSRQIFAPQLGSFERSLEHQAMRMEHALRPGLPQLNFASAALATGAANTALSNSTPKALDHIVFNMGGDGGQGEGSGPRSNGTGSGGREATLSFSTASQGRAGDPRQVHGVLDIMRRIQEPNSLFMKELQSHDIVFDIQGAFQAEKSIPRLLDLLNNLVAPYQGLKTQNQIPSGRKVILRAPGLEGFPAREYRLFLSNDGFSLAQKTNQAGQRAITPPETPAPKPRRQRRATNFPGFEVPEQLQMDSFFQLMRRIMEHKAEFQDTLVTNNIAIKVSSEMGFSMDSLLRSLNGLPRLAEIPVQRRINIQLGPEKTSLVAIKLKDVFINPFSAEQSSAVSDSSVPPSVERPLRTPIRPPRKSSNPPEGPEENIATDSSSEILLPGSTPPPTILGEQHIPRLTDSIEMLPFQMRAQTQANGQVSGPIILEGLKVELRALEESTRGKVFNSPQGTRWDVLVPANAEGHQSFLAEIRSKGLQWRLGSNRSWMRVSGQVLYSKTMVRTPAEIYQLITAYARDPGRSESAETVLEHHGELSQAYLNGLSEFTWRSLNHYGVHGRSIRVQNPEGETLFGFERLGEQWQLNQQGE